MYIGKATELSSRVGSYYTTPLGAAKPHAGGWFLKTLDDMGRLFVHFAACGDPPGQEAEMLGAFIGAVGERTRRALHDPARPFPFANLEWPAGNRKAHGIRGARGALAAEHNPAPGPASSLSPVASARRTARSVSEAITQPVTQADVRAGRIRVPASVKPLFADDRRRIVVQFRGVSLDCSWDPRNGPDRARSGVIGAGREALVALGPSAGLTVTRSDDVFFLD